MSPKNRTRLFLEALEDRAVPAVSYTLDGSGNLTVSGQTNNASYAITSTGAGVTIVDGISTHMFVVSGNLTVNLQMTNATPRFDYAPGVDSGGGVALNVSSLFGLSLGAAGTAAGVNVLGPLSITTGGGSDNIDVSNLDIHGGLTINSGAGFDTVIVGDNTLAPPVPIGPVTVEGNLTIQNGNVIGLGSLVGAPPVLVQGITSLSTDITAGITAVNRNNIDIEPQVTLQGALIASMNGPFQIFSTQGLQESSVYVHFGAGLILSTLQQNQATFGSVTETADAGASFSNAVLGQGGMDFNGIIGGNVQVVAGNGRNDVVFHATIGGKQVSYYGGNGVDNVTWAFDASAYSAALNIYLNAGNDSAFVENSNWTRAVFDGGFGTNMFTASVALGSNTTVKNF